VRQGKACHACNGYGDAGHFLAQQQLPDKRRNDQQRLSGSRFADSGDNQHLFHGLDYS
jgi:hypothetical protein